jgi:hypothetical protein
MFLIPCWVSTKGRTREITEQENNMSIIVITFDAPKAAMTKNSRL